MHTRIENQTPTIQMPEIATKYRELLSGLQEWGVGNPELPGWLFSKAIEFKNEPRIFAALKLVTNLVQDLAFEPKFHSLINWRDCKGWIEAEVLKASGFPTDDLNFYRQIFSFSSEIPRGWEISAARRKDLRIRSELHHGILSNLTAIEGTNCGSELINVCLFDVRRALSCCNHELGLGNGDRFYYYGRKKDEALKIVSDLYRSNLFLDSRTMLPSLARYPLEVREELSRSIEARLYERICEPQSSVWEEVENMQLDWMPKGSTREQIPFSKDILQEVFEGDGAFVITTRENGRLTSFALTIEGSENFLPQTKEKLRQISPYSIPNATPDAWQFLTVADPQTIMEYGRKGVDFYRLYTDFTKQELIFRNCVTMLGIVDERNPARFSHLRIGCEVIDPNTKFPTDSGGMGIIVGSDLNQ